MPRFWPSPLFPFAGINYYGSLFPYYFTQDHVKMMFDLNQCLYSFSFYYTESPVLLVLHPLLLLQFFIIICFQISFFFLHLWIKYIFEICGMTCFVPIIILNTFSDFVWSFSSYFRRCCHLSVSTGSMGIKGYALEINPAYVLLTQVLLFPIIGRH